MKKFLKAAQIVAVVFAVVLFTFGAAQSANASLLGSTGLNLGSSFDLLQNSSGSESSVVGSTNITFSTCRIFVDSQTVSYGDAVNVTWDTSGFDDISINGQSVSGDTGTLNVTNITTNTIFELVAVEGGNECTATVRVTCIPPPVLECKLEIEKVVDKSTAKPGDELTYTITVKNTGTGPCTGGGVKIVDNLHSYVDYLSNTVTSNITEGYGVKPVYDATTRTLYFNGNTLDAGEEGTITWKGVVTSPSSCGDYEVTNQAKATAFELNNFLTWVYSQTVRTDIDNDCVTPIVSCDTFSAVPSSIVKGDSSTLSWTTTNASRIVIDNGIGDVTADGNKEISPLVSTTYILTVYDGSNQIADTCSVPVVVSELPLPVCNYFTATPNSLPVGGGNVTLSWDVSRVSEVSILPTVGIVPAVSTKTLFVNQSQVYVLTAENLDGGKTECEVPVTVNQDVPFTCSNNVVFTSSDYSITRGSSVTLDWDVTGADSVSISEIDTTAATGNKSVSPSSDTTYVLTATKGSESIDCPITVRVSSGGGGGGGSSSPRCELEISDKKIKRGEEVTLKWDTSRATEITLTDDKGKVLFTTEDMTSTEKKKYYDSEITITPTRNTEYTLLAEKGTRDDECTVKVEMDDLTVLQTRDQQPLVAGISLSNVPYTGFEAGPVLTLMFYLLLMAWALYVTYFLVLRQRTVGNGQFTSDVSDGLPFTESGMNSMKNAETIRPDVFTASSVETPVAATPSNLPVAKTVGYENYFGGIAVSEKAADEVVTELENRAHGQRALLSSDAIEYFMKTTEGTVERNEALDSVISEAKKHYPLEDGWIVINQIRMHSLCETCVVKDTTPEVTASLPEGSGSLAEAIVTGNIVAAYALIGNRPMFSLAEAAADFDSLYRNRKGASEAISDMLAAEGKNLSDQQLTNVIKSLTGALDGTYTDEASAVKMAIMKAVKEVA